MFVSYQMSQSMDIQSLKIIFLPTGEVDLIQTNMTGFNLFNEILNPTISLINGYAARANITDFDFWRLMNWMFVSHYWTILLDFGQVSPTTFQYDDSGILIGDGLVKYPATNNIFVNETLFAIYSSYLTNTVLPLFNYTLPPFEPLNRTNAIKTSEVTFKMLYSCTDLQLKSSGSLVVSVMVASWAFITSLYALLVSIGSKWELRKEEGRCLVCSH